jgi:hypothetical protein
VNAKTELDVFALPEGNIGLPRARFPRVLPLTGGRLDPIEGFPVVWRFTHPEGGRPAVVINVLGLLNGGPISISTRGSLYEARDKGRLVGLFMPGAAKGYDLGAMRHKVLAPEKYKKPLYPTAWPKEAVAQVVRARFRTWIVLDPAWLLAQIHRLAPAAAFHYDPGRTGD